MKRLYPSLFCALIVFLVSACDPFAADQIRDQAKADQLAAETVQKSLDQEQARQQAADLHAIQLQEEKREQARLDAVEQDVRKGLQFMITTAFLVGTAVVVFAIFVIGRITVFQLARIQEGFATAMITAVDVRSRLIFMDPNTRQFPLLYQYNGKGRYLVTDPNTKVTMELDSRNEGDAQMIAGAIAIRHSGVLVMEQRKSGAKDAASMAVIQPPIIEGTEFDVKTVARDLITLEAENE